MAQKRHLSLVEIRKLAALIQLSLTDEEVEKLREDLDKTVDYVNNIDELKEAIERMRKNQPVPDHINQTFSDEEANRRHLDKDEVFGNSKSKDKPYFVVKKVQ